jgi:hypothetical protein
MTTVIAALIAFAGGVFAQWATSKASRQKLDREYHAAAIKAWREKLTACQSVKEFLGTAEYSALRPHLYPKLRDPIENGSLEWTPAGARPGTQVYQALMDYIATLERWWGLMPHADGQYAARGWQKRLFTDQSDEGNGAPWWRRVFKRRRSGPVSNGGNGDE